MSVHYSNIAVTKVLLLRGNTIQNNRYVGLPGEPTVDTQLYELRVHDGSTPGGHVVQSQTGSLVNGSQFATLGTTGNLTFTDGTFLTVANGNLLVNGNVIQGGSGGNVANLWNSGKTVSLGTNGITTFPGDIYFNNNSGVIEQGANRLTITGNAIQVNTGAYFNDDGEAAIFANTSVQIATNSNSVNPPLWDFSSTGNLTFPTGASIVNGYPGAHGTIGDGESWFVTPSTQAGGIASADGQQYLQVNNGQGVLIGTAWTGSGYQWTFGQDGSLTMPAASNGESLIVASGTGLGISAGSKGWTFDNTGNLTFPDNSTQRTAYSNAAVSTYLASTTTQTLGGAVTVVGNLTVQGNLILNGNSTLVSTNNLIINDNIIYIANANPGSSLDIGFAGHFTAGGFYQHTGLVRQASTNTWKLFSNVVPEPGATIDFTNAVYDDIQVGNITSPTITGLNANAVAQQTLINSLQANAASQETEIQSLFSNATAQQTTINTLLANAATQSDLIIGINANITQANVGIKGYIDLGNTIQSAQVNAANLAITAANVGVVGYVNQQVTAANTAANQANVGMLGYVNNQSFYSNTKVATYLQYGNISNISVAGNVTATYFIGNGALLTGIAASSNYSNVQVATYLPTYTGNIANVRLGPAGVLTFADGTTQTTAATGGSSYSNVNVAAYLNATGYNLYSNVNVAAYLAGNVTIGNLTVSGNLSANLLSITANSITGTNANTTITAGVFTSTFNNQGNVLLPNVGVTGNVTTGGYFIGNGSQLTGLPSSYSNVQVAAYLNTNNYSPYSNVNVANYLTTATITTTGNITAQNISGNISITGNITGTQSNVTLQAGTFNSVFNNQGNVLLPNVYVSGNIQTSGYLFGNGAFLTGIVTGGGGGSNYGNSNVAAYLPTYFGNVGNVKFGTSSIGFPFGTQFLEVTNLTSEILVPYQFTVNTNGGSIQYTFGNSGYLGLPAGVVFPDSTQQITAFSNAAVLTYLTSVNPVQLGSGAGATSQGTDAVAIGRSAGKQQGTESVAIGVIAGQTNQGSWGVAIGSSAGTSNQGQRAVAIGVQAAEVTQGAGAVAIGAYAGDNNQGQYAVAIGTHAGDSNQPASSIILNASGSALNGTNSGLYINPVRNDLANVANVVYYNAVTNELTYAPAASSSYSNVQVATYLPTYSGNIANLTLGPSGILTFADGTTQTTAGGGGGSNYSNANVSSYLINSSSTFIGNTGNVSVANIYALQSNITQLFIGNQTSLSSGNSSVTTNTWLLNNLFFNSAGNLAVRNTQAGYNYIQMGTNGIMLGGYLGASTANTVASIFTPWMTVNGTTGLVLTGGLTAGSTVAVNSAAGITTNQTTFPLVNATATTVNFGGAATSITMGSTTGTGNVFFGGNAILQATNAALGTNLYPLVLRPAGQYNYLLIYGIAGGYNSPPYTSQALTGGNGSGMTASYSSVGGYVSQSSLVVTNPGTGYRNGDILTLPGGLGTTVLLFNYNPAKTSNTAAASYTFGFDGNLTLPGNIIFPSSSYIYGDFSNATVNSRTVFVTTGNSTTTGIYAVPSGTGTGAAWQAANSSNLTAASKIMITTNGSTDVQLVSGINGTGTYLPLSFYNNGSAQMQLTVAGNLNMTVNNSISTSGTGYFIGNSVGTTATYTGNVTAGGIVATQYGNSYGTTATYTGNITAGGSSGPQTRFLWDTWQANSTSALSAFTPSGTIGGNATWDSTQAYGLKLTTTTTTQSGYISWNSSTVNYTYDMTITASIGASGGTGADGQWIFFGANAAVSGNPGNTNSFGGIAVMNHFYSGANQFEVYVNGTQTNIPFILEGSSSYNPSGITVWNASYTSFYNMTLKIRKIQNGARMLEVYLNEAYQGAVNIGTWTPSGNYYGVAAYTGGSTAQMWVRQLRIDW